MSAERSPPAEHHGIEEHLLHDHRWALRVALALWVVSAGLFVAMEVPSARAWIDDVDRWVYDTVYPFKWAPLTAVAFTLSYLGSGYFLWPVRFVVSVWLAARRRWRAFATWVLAVAVSEPLIGILKAAYGRPRPPESLVATSNAAFPSGHAVAGAVVAITLVIVLVPPGPPRRNLEMAAAAFAVIMAGSRVYLGAHWSTDVVAGVSLGAACALAAATVVQWWFERRVDSSRSAVS